VRYHSRIVGGSLAPRDACCDVVHLDAEGNLTDRNALSRLLLSTPIGRRYVDLCGDHDSAVGSDLARWSHPVEAAQFAAEGTIDGMLTEVLSENSPLF
jgi:hypothetical protein